MTQGEQLQLEDGGVPAPAAGPHRTFTATDLTELRQIAQRLHSDLRGLVLLLPPDAAAGASAMSRALQVDRATCQRVLNIIRQPADSLEVILGAPGVRGMRIFVTALAQEVGEHSLVSSATATIERFKVIVKKMAGSQTRLCKRIREMGQVQQSHDNGEPGVTGDTPGVLDERAANRRDLFRNALDIVGRYTTTLTIIQLFRPLPEDPRKVESASVYGFLGHRRYAESMPFVLQHIRKAVSPVGTIKKEPFASSGPVLEEFSTKDAFRLTPVQREHANAATISYVVDCEEDEPIDILTANRPQNPSPHPALRTPQLEECWMIPTFPARYGLLDVYAHRELARTSIQTLDVHLWSPSLFQTMDFRWPTRLPHGPQLQMLGFGTANAASPLHARHAELTRYLFDQLGWDANEFLGFRCSETYPIWRAGYRIAMDYTGCPMKEEMAQ